MASTPRCQPEDASCCVTQRYVMLSQHIFGGSQGILGNGCTHRLLSTTAASMGFGDGGGGRGGGRAGGAHAQRKPLNSRILAPTPTGEPHTLRPQSPSEPFPKDPSTENPKRQRVLNSCSLRRRNPMQPRSATTGPPLAIICTRLRQEAFQCLCYQALGSTRLGRPVGYFVFSLVGFRREDHL